MSPFLAELIGTMLLIVLGDGVVANIVLHKIKGHDSGWKVTETGLVNKKSGVRRPIYQRKMRLLVE